jgi:predicted HAD superfamily phosphohydrolase
MHDAARDALQKFNPDLLTNSSHADELRRMAEAVDEFNADADCTMVEIMERFTPEQYEAAIA